MFKITLVFIAVFALVYLVSTYIAIKLIPVRMAAWKKSYMTRTPASLATQVSPVFLTNSGCTNVTGYDYAMVYPQPVDERIYYVWALVPVFNTLDVLMVGIVTLTESIRKFYLASRAKAA